jgi:hypothetical protein
VRSYSFCESGDHDETDIPTSATRTADSYALRIRARRLSRKDRQFCLPPHRRKIWLPSAQRQRWNAYLLTVLHPFMILVILSGAEDACTNGHEG